MFKISLSFVEHHQSFLAEYQSLIGSILGVVGAGLIAIFTILLTRYFNRRWQVRENIRMLEVQTSRGLESVFNSRKLLEEFVSRLDDIVINPLLQGEVKGFCLSETNFPVLKINFNLDLVNGIFRSYYLHNKVLIASSLIGSMNSQFIEMKDKYNDIIRKNEFLITQKPGEDNQRKFYLEHNQAFKNYVAEVVSALDTTEKVLVQIKVQNLKHLKKQKRLIRKTESAPLKYLFSRSKREEYTATIEAVDRIDEAIEPEVRKMLSKVYKRFDDINAANQGN